MAAFTLLLSAFVTKIYAHSWARCVDYKAEITGLDYDETQCEGWIRGRTFDYEFGLDRGVDSIANIGGGGNVCRDALTGTADNDYGYANTDKIAQYTSGSTVRVVWPAKNHANYECGTGFTPDSSMKLYWNPQVDPTADLASTASTMEARGYELVKDWHDGCTPGTDGCGFQNCRQYCANTDKATCFGDFVVPDVTTAGYYTFVWYWVFNRNTSPYTSCYEAYVEPASAETGTDDFAQSSGSSQTVNGYVTQAPICITYGNDYDSSGLKHFVQGRLIAAMDETDTLEIISESTGSGAMNFTIQVEHSSSGSEVSTVLWDGTKAGNLRDDTLCDDFMIAYSGTTCRNCLDVITYALFDSGVDAKSGYLGIFVGAMLAVFVYV